MSFLGMFFSNDHKKDGKEGDKQPDDVAPPMPKKTDNSVQQQKPKFQRPLPKQTTEAGDPTNGAPPEQQIQVAVHHEEQPTPQPDMHVSESTAKVEQRPGLQVDFLQRMRMKKEQEALNKTNQSLNQSQDREEPAHHHRNDSLNGTSAKVLEEATQEQDQLPAEKPKFGFLNKPKAPGPEAPPQEDQAQETQALSLPKKFIRPAKKQQPVLSDEQSQEQPEASPQEVAEVAVSSGLNKFFRPGQKSRTPDHSQEPEEQDHMEGNGIENEELDTHTPIVQTQGSQPSTKFNFLNRKKQPEAETGDNVNDQTLNLSIIDRDQGDNIEDTLHKDDSSHHSHKSTQANRIESKSFVSSRSHRIRFSRSSSSSTREER